MQTDYNLDNIEIFSRWVSLLECLMIFDKGCKMKRLDPEIEFSKLKPNIIVQYINDRSPTIEKDLSENKDNFFINSFLVD